MGSNPNMANIAALSRKGAKQARAAGAASDDDDDGAGGSAAAAPPAKRFARVCGSAAARRPKAPRRPPAPSGSPASSDDSDAACGSAYGSANASGGHAATPSSFISADDADGCTADDASEASAAAEKHDVWSLLPALSPATTAALAAQHMMMVFPAPARPASPCDSADGGANYTAPCLPRSISSVSTATGAPEAATGLISAAAVPCWPDFSAAAPLAVSAAGPAPLAGPLGCGHFMLSPYGATAVQPAVLLPAAAAAAAPLQFLQPPPLFTYGQPAAMHAGLCAPDAGVASLNAAAAADMVLAAAPPPAPAPAPAAKAPAEAPRSRLPAPPPLDIGLSAADAAELLLPSPCVAGATIASTMPSIMAAAPTPSKSLLGGAPAASGEEDDEFALEGLLMDFMAQDELAAGGGAADCWGADLFAARW
jgi:hypothetical protein